MLRPELLCIGDVNLDLITSPVGDYPRRDTQSSVSIRPHIGGEAANTAMAAARLGVPTTFVGAIGTDWAANFVRQKLQQKNLTAKLIDKKGKKTAMTFALTFENSDRTFFTDSSANNFLTFKDVPPKLVKNNAITFVGGYWHLLSLLEGGNTRLFKSAQHNNRRTSLGLGWNYRGWTGGRRRQLYSTLDNVDVLFANGNELKDITGTGSIPDSCAKLLNHTGLVVAHLGPNGCYIGSDDISFRVPAKKVQIRNPVGAGDAFNAAFLQGMLRNDSLRKSAEHAVRVAAAYAGKAPASE